MQSMCIRMATQQVALNGPDTTYKAYIDNYHSHVNLALIARLREPQPRKGLAVGL